jgi:hypothetical protein
MDDQRTADASGESLKAPQFSLKRLLVSTTLIAVGVAFIANVVMHQDNPSALMLMFKGSPTPFLSLWLGSGTCIEAGQLSLFNKSRTGAVLGVFAALAVLIYLVMANMPWRS